MSSEPANQDDERFYPESAELDDDFVSDLNSPSALNSASVADGDSRTQPRYIPTHTRVGTVNSTNISNESTRGGQIDVQKIFQKFQGN